MKDPRPGPCWGGGAAHHQVDPERGGAHRRGLQQGQEGVCTPPPPTAPGRRGEGRGGGSGTQRLNTHSDWSSAYLYSDLIGYI